MKKILSVLLLICMLFTTGCQSAAPAPAPSAPAASAPAPATPAPAAPAEPRVFTDSLGREVTIPAEIEKVALSGPMAQIVLFALCPDKLVGVSDAWSTEAELYLPEDYFNLPEIGQLYGGKGNLNLETLLNSGAQIVIDVGEPKDGMAEDLDALQEQAGLPFIHITAHTDTMGDAYRTLGEVLGMEKEAEALAEYCDATYQKVLEVSQSVEKVDVLYVTGDTGQNVISKNAYHAEVIDMMTNNLAIVDAPSAKGTGNEVGMEQILIWDPEVILFCPESCFESVADDPAWQEVTAIQTDRYYKVPFGPYNWMGFPPSVQRYLGMLWAGALLYPDAVDYDLYEEVAEYYKLFYHCDLTRDLYDALVADSIGKTTAQ